MKQQTGIDRLVEGLEKGYKHAKVVVFKNGKIYEIDHNFEPAVVREIKPKGQEGKK